MYLTAAAFKLKVGNSARKLVLLKLADNANDNGECFPSFQYIADQCEMSKRSVMRHIQELEELGYVIKIHRMNEYGQSSNLYRLNFEFAGKGTANKEVVRGDKLSSGGDCMSRGGDKLSSGGGDTVSPITSHSFNQSINQSCADAPVSAKAKTEKAPTKEIFDLYNEILGDQLPKAQVLSDKRKKAIAARWNELFNTKNPQNGNTRYADKDSGLKWWSAFFKKVKLNPHWVGDNNRGWTADLDWITNSANFVKILEWRPAQKGGN